MKFGDCKIYHESEYVSWTIPKENIEETLLGSKNKKGLLYLKVESAGEIQFQDTSCKINNKNEKLCDKTMKSTLKYKNGNSDSVLTPLSVVNFHTHPLNCYIDGKTIWGWPSGEDLGQCFKFAKDNNLTHLIFAIEGTYIIDVNKTILHYLQSNKKLFNIVVNNIVEIFKLTHKHRMYKNESTSLSLEKEFYNIFLKPIGLPEKQNILLSWLNLVNNLTLHKLKILSDELNRYFSEILKIPIALINNTYSNMKLFNIQFYPNETILWSNLSKTEIFNNLKTNKKNLSIKLPNKIVYSAPFISESCKL